MKKSISIFIILVIFLVLYSDEKPDIAGAYKKSYDYEIMQKYDKAIKALSEVYRTYPNTYTVNYRLGWLYYLDKKYSNALEHLNAALKIFPSSIEVLNTIDLVYAATQDWTKLETNATKIINIDYYNVYANYWYSYSLKKQNKISLALKVDYKMLTVYPASETFLTELAENLYLSGDITTAEQKFKDVLILNSLNETAKYYLKLIEKNKDKEKSEK